MNCGFSTKADDSGGQRQAKYGGENGILHFHLVRQRLCVRHHEQNNHGGAAVPFPSLCRQPDGRAGFRLHASVETRTKPCSLVPKSPSRSSGEILQLSSRPPVRYVCIFILNPSLVLGFKAKPFVQCIHAALLAAGRVRVLVIVVELCC